MPDVPDLFRIVIHVPSLPRGVAFYRRLLGLQGKNIWGSRHYFDCGRTILALLDPKSEGYGFRPLPDTVYFAVRDLEAVFRRARRLRCLSTGSVHEQKAGEIAVRPWGERSFYAADPFGNELCFVDRKTCYRGRPRRRAARTR
jgi:catechol 2,3-dioxygenase-like lactoylglutathione lyase family enzyme